MVVTSKSTKGQKIMHDDGCDSSETYILTKRPDISYTHKLKWHVKVLQKEKLNVNVTIIYSVRERSVSDVVNYNSLIKNI